MLNNNYSEIEKLYATNWLKADRYLIDLYKKKKIRKLYKRPDLKKRKPLVYNMSNQTIIKGGASRTNDNPFSYVYNLTGTLLDCFKLLMPDADVTTVSIFNPSITQISKNMQEFIQSDVFLLEKSEEAFNYFDYAGSI